MSGTETVPSDADSAPSEPKSDSRFTFRVLRIVVIGYVLSYVGISLSGSYWPGFTSGGFTEMEWIPRVFVDDKDELRKPVAYFYLPCWFVDTAAFHRTYRINEMEGWRERAAQQKKQQGH